MLAITVMLLNRRRVTAHDLADHFEVSVRTIYRDIDTLNHAGIPIISSQGYEGGFSIPDNYKLSRQLLTFNDMVSILTTLTGINTSLKNPDIERVIEKITALIPLDKKEEFEKQSDSFIIDITPWGKSPHLNGVMQQVHQGISESRLLRFDYTGAQGEKSKRDVEPHTLIFKNFNWYVLSFCRLRQDFRVFRLSRMRQLLLKTEYFSRRQVNAKQYFNAKNETTPVLELTLLFSRKVQIHVEEIFDNNDLTYNEDDTITARFFVPEDDWILSFILGFGDSVEIISPPLLRQSLKKKVEKMQQIYSNLT